MVFMFPIQLKIKAGFGAGAWLSPSLSPCMFVKGKSKNLYLASEKPPGMEQRKTKNKGLFYLLPLTS